MFITSDNFIVFRTCYLVIVWTCRLDDGVREFKPGPWLCLWDTSGYRITPLLTYGASPHVSHVFEHFIYKFELFCQFQKNLCDHFLLYIYILALIFIYIVQLVFQFLALIVDQWNCDREFYILFSFTFWHKAPLYIGEHSLITWHL